MNQSKNDLIHPVKRMSVEKHRQVIVSMYNDRMHAVKTIENDICMPSVF